MKSFFEFFSDIKNTKVVIKSSPTHQFFFLFYFFSFLLSFINRHTNYTHPLVQLCMLGTWGLAYGILAVRMDDWWCKPIIYTQCLYKIYRTIKCAWSSPTLANIHSCAGKTFFSFCLLYIYYFESLFVLLIVIILFG